MESENGRGGAPSGGGLPMRSTSWREEILGGRGMGWWPDYPDFRDFSPEHEEVAGMVSEANLVDVAGVNLQAAVNPPYLAYWPPVEDQGSLGSCTANAGVALVEYFERVAAGKHIDASRLFLYKVTRNLLHWSGDTGAMIRTTMGAMVIFGVPPEEYWPYDVENFDEEPPSFSYSFAQNYQAIRYLRLDPLGIQRPVLLQRIKAFISAGIPSMFGFTVYSSISQAEDDGKIPFPCPGEGRVGGHALVAIGYNDDMEIENTICGTKTTGALLVRNSWGSAWGDGGYGWFPYDYVLTGLAVDWWTLMKNEWIDTGAFKL